MKIITQNKKAFFDYEVLEKIEAGVVLTGDEVKSLRAGHVSLVGAFAVVHKNELFLMNASITPYSHAYIKGTDESATRSRKLLLHRGELDRLIGDISRKGITIVPLKLYFKNGRVKAELGICKHKKAAGKKQAIKERDIRRETERELRSRK